jgi:hypothetical protein
MKHSFSEVKIFQVKPDKQEDFETLMLIIAEEQKSKMDVLTLNMSNVFIQ